MRRQNGFHGIVLSVVLLFMGCNTTGLSLREGGDVNFSSVLYSLKASGKNDEIKAPLQTPMVIAVSQIGETAPLESVVETLKQSPYVSKVITVPGDVESFRTPYFHDTKEEKVTPQSPAIRQLAKELGADYLFIFGGNIDSGIEAGWFSLFDIATIGLLVPSQNIYMEGTAAGVLMDVNRGNVYFIVNAKDKINTYAPLCLATSKEERLRVTMRDQLANKLGKNMVLELGKVK